MPWECKRLQKPQWLGCCFTFQLNVKPELQSRRIHVAGWAQSKSRSDLDLKTEAHRCSSSHNLTEPLESLQSRKSRNFTLHKYSRTLGGEIAVEGDCTCKIFSIFILKTLLETFIIVTCIHVSEHWAVYCLCLTVPEKPESVPLLSPPLFFFYFSWTKACYRYKLSQGNWSFPAFQVSPDHTWWQSWPLISRALSTTTESHNYLPYR